jgi:hypothetical protein
MKLISQYNKEEYPKMSIYGCQNVIGNRSKKHPDKHLFFMDWLNKTYPNKYSDVKKGDYFILWNGNNNPVAMYQDNTDKYKRPTRLNDGSYLGLELNKRVVIVNKDLATSLAKESRNYWKKIMQ